MGFSLHFLHRWTPWEETFRGREKIGSGNGYPVMIQERRCLVCKRIDVRVIRTRVE